MWIRSENSEPVMPETKIISGDRVILNRNFRLVEASGDKPAHYEFETWDMSAEAYEVYKYMQSQLDDQADALIELAELFTEEE